MQFPVTSSGCIRLLLILTIWCVLGNCFGCSETGERTEPDGSDLLDSKNTETSTNQQ